MRGTRPFRNRASSSNISIAIIRARRGSFPATPTARWQTRLRDRFYDLYVHLPMQKIVGDRLRPQGKKDPHGVEEARARLRTCYGMIDQEMATRTWAMGEAFSLADCAAAPALFYANKVVPFGEGHENVDGLSRAPEGAAVLRARAEGGRAVFRDVPADSVRDPAAQLTSEIILCEHVGAAKPGSSC